MRVTIHQPEHFPYMGFFQKMKTADLFIVLDNVKYRKNYFQNRNKFPNAQGRDEWFTIPVNKRSNNSLIKDVYTVPDNGWRKKLLKQMKFNFGYDLERVYEPDKLIDINMLSIKFCREKLGIRVPMEFASNLVNDLSSSELLVNLCKSVNASTYISGPSGRDYLNVSLFEEENIGVEFFDPHVKNYYSALYNITKEIEL
jgi:hypothetical protein